MVNEQDIRQRFRLLVPALNERTRRLWAAAEARSGSGRHQCGARATGVSRRAIAVGLRELQARRALADPRVRRPGGGRKSLRHTDPKLLDRLDRLVEPTTRGDPMSPLRWTTKSVRKLAAQLTAQGHPVRIRPSPRCSMRWTIAYSPTARTPKAPTIPTGTGNSAISPDGRGRSSWLATRSSRWTPRRRNSSATSRMPAGSGGPRAARAGAGPRLYRSRNGQGHPVRVYDLAANRGLGERGDRP